MRLSAITDAILEEAVRAQEPLPSISSCFLAGGLRGMVRWRLEVGITATVRVGLDVASLQ